MKFWGDLMSALFPDDHHQRFPQNRERTDQRAHIRERIAANMYSNSKFLFLYLFMNRFSKE